MSAISTGVVENLTYSNFFYASEQLKEKVVEKPASRQLGLGWVGATAAAALLALPVINTTAHPRVISENDSSIESRFGRSHSGITLHDQRWEELVSNIVSGATLESGTQLSNFFRAMPHADRYAVWAILQDVQQVFAGFVVELDLEHKFDYEADRNQLFVSVETGLSTKEILEKRKIFDYSVLTDDAKKAASKYTITTFF